MGHGGTLDPMATGVLIVGVGKGTKCLTRFLECTKTYECVVLFGAATDSFDAVGKVVSKADYEHVTKELVEEKLEQFRGKIMQKPSIFSALKVDGKKMYEYAREGKDIPEVAPRPVEVLDMELVEWLEPGSHDFAWPKEEVDGEAMEGAEKLLGIRKADADVYAATAGRKEHKRVRDAESDNVDGAGPQPKKPRTDSEPAMSGALPASNAPVEGSTAEQPPTEQSTTEQSTTEEPPTQQSTTEPSSTAQPTPIAPTQPILEAAIPTEDRPTSSVEHAENNDIPTRSTMSPSVIAAERTTTPTPSPPAARLRMTVTSGFYVRSLCHDLGLACSSLGLMSSLIRSRQGDYRVGENVVNFSDLEAGPETWEPLVQKQLEEFMEKEGWEAEEAETEEQWEERKKEVMAQRKEEGRERSYRGGGRGKWQGRGGGGGNRYSKNMDGERRGHD